MIIDFNAESSNWSSNDTATAEDLIRLPYIFILYETSYN